MFFRGGRFSDCLARGRLRSETPVDMYLESNAGRKGVEEEMGERDCSWGSREDSRGGGARL